jgi:thiosulfate/3-mercaptopyruvate sulfurtransferase
MSVLVSTEWVQEHLNDPNIRLIEVDVDTSAYEQGHILAR